MLSLLGQPRRRVPYSRSVLVLLGLLGLLGARSWVAQDVLCAWSDTISDACSTLGVGHRPSREERFAWQAVAPGDCYDLRMFLRQYPSGALAARARAAMVAPRARWEMKRTLRTGHVDEGPTFLSKGLAYEDAMRRADEQNERDCVTPPGVRRGRGAVFTIPSYEAPPPPELWPMQFRAVPGGFVTDFDYSASCGYYVPEIVPNCGAPGADAADTGE